MNDANWLPSTVVQASAAFVAITGGFLVTRLIAISSEISEFKTKISELTLSREPIEQEFLNTRNERIRIDREKFHKYWVGKEEMEKDDVAPEFLIDNYPLTHGEPSDLKEYSERIVAEYKNARHIMQRNVPSSHIPSDSKDWLETYFEWDEFNLPIIQHVANIERNKRVLPLGLPKSILYLNGMSSFYESITELGDRQSERIRHESQLKQDLGVLDSQIALNHHQIAMRVNPNHFRFLIGLLSYMSIVGILLPATAMGLDPIPASSLFKFTLIGLLSIGIFAFCFYLAVVVNSYVKDGKSGI